MGEESNRTTYTSMRKKKKHNAKYEWILKKKKVVEGLWKKNPGKEILCVVKLSLEWTHLF